MKTLASIFAVLSVLVASTASAASTCKAKRIHYLQLHKGMSYPEVAKLIGCVGDETFGYDGAGIVMKSYTWQAGQFGYLNVSFTNGELDSVMQSGLE